MRAHAFNMACRVDLTLLLPRRTAKQEGQRVNFSVQGEITPAGSPQLERPKLLSPPRSRYRTISEDRTLGVWPFTVTQQVERRGGKRDALILGEPPLLGDRQLALDPAALTWVDVSAHVPNLTGLSCDIERNPLSEPDTCDVVVRADELPIDLRILRGAQVDVWLYTHRDPSACRKGDAGHFAGIVRSIDKDRNSNEVTLSCVDYTWALDQAKMTPAMLAVELDKPFDEVVSAILQLVPGADQWDVLSSSDGFGGDAKKALGLRERKRKEKRTDVTQRQVRRVIARPNGTTEQTRIIIPRRVETVKAVTEQPTVGHALGRSDRTAWEAVQFLAAMTGYVPNVSIGSNGRPRVEILRPEDIHGGVDVETGSIYSDEPRRFADGVNIRELRESIDFGASIDVDRIEVRSANPNTGETYRGIAGRERGRWEHDGKIDVQVAHGLSSSAECQRRAAEAWRSYINAEFSVELVTQEPWSLREDAGPDDPGDAGYKSDLLFAKPGEPVQIAFAGLEAAAKVMGVDHTPESAVQAAERLLRSRGVPENAAKRIATAMREQSPTTLFQIRTITHSFDAVGDGDYTATLQLDAFLGRPDDQPKVVDSPLELEGAA